MLRSYRKIIETPRNKKKSIWNYTIEGSLCLGLLMITPPSLPARELNESDVRAAVQTWVRHVTADARPEAVIEFLEPYSVDNGPVAYIAHLEGGGFCLCGADDLVLPVYYYCPWGKYDGNHPGYKQILEEIKNRTEELKRRIDKKDLSLQNYTDALRKRSQFWSNLIKGLVPNMPIENKTTKSEPTMMELNFTTCWHQGAPYNNVCPMGDGGQCVVGCVATAASMIMKYWDHPSSGEGSPSYNWDGDDSCGGSVGGGTLSATCSDAYDWSNMPDACTAGSPQAQQDAVAELCYEAGVAFSMDYGVCGSSSSIILAEWGMESHFRYDTDGWVPLWGINIDDMVKEITWLRPFSFRGANAAGDGHAWVIYGYNKGTDPDRQFRMYMGWGGNPGWFSCDQVDFSEGQQHHIQIAPANVVQFVGASDAGDGSPDDPYRDIEEAVTEAPDEATLIFRAGSTNWYSGGEVVINRPFTLKSYNAVIEAQ